MLVALLAVVGALALGVLSLVLASWWRSPFGTRFGAGFGARRREFVTDCRMASNRKANGLPGYHYVVGTCANPSNATGASVRYAEGKGTP
jgi:hypothetical protein